MNLDDIPESQTDGFPIGVSEVHFETPTEMEAFLHGLTYADDIDVEHGTPFWRDYTRVVRVRVGNWEGDEE